MSIQILLSQEERLKAFIDEPNPIILFIELDLSSKPARVSYDCAPVIKEALNGAEWKNLDAAMVRVWKVLFSHLERVAGQGIVNRELRLHYGRRSKRG